MCCCPYLLDTGTNIYLSICVYVKPCLPATALRHSSTLSTTFFQRGKWLEIPPHAHGDQGWSPPKAWAAYCTRSPSHSWWKQPQRMSNSSKGWLGRFFLRPDLWNKMEVCSGRPVVEKEYQNFPPYTAESIFWWRISSTRISLPKTRHCTSTWNDAMHKGCCACRSSSSPSVPGKQSDPGKTQRGLRLSS